MKPIIPFALLGALLAVGAADAAATDPVGYITHTLAGNPTANPFGADTYISPTLSRVVEFAGASSADPSGLTTVAFAGTSVPTTLDGTYFVEITSGAREGWWSVIASSTNNSITTVDAFPAALGGNVSVEVRKIQTLGSFLGANTPGLGATDEVQILDPVTQVVTTARWVAVPGEWQDAVTEGNLDTLPIYPGTALKMRVFGASGITFVSSGDVKTTKTEVDVYPNSNWIGATLAAGSTLGGINLATQLNEEDFNAGTNPPADIVEFINPDQSASSYIDVGAFMQDLVLETDATSLPVPEGSGFGILRDGSAPASIVVIPAQLVNP